MKHQFDMFEDATIGVTPYTVGSGSLGCSAPNQVIDTLLRQRCETALSRLEPTFIPVGYEVELLARHYYHVSNADGRSVSTGSQSAPRPADLAARRFAARRHTAFQEILEVEEFRTVPQLSERETAEQTQHVAAELNCYLDWLFADPANWHMNARIPDCPKPHAAIESITLMTHELILIAEAFFDEWCSCKFESWAYDMYFGNDSCFMAAAGGRLAKIQSVLGDELYDFVVTPIAYRWRARFADAERNKAYCEWCGRAESVYLAMIYGTCEICDGEAEQIHRHWESLSTYLADVHELVQRSWRKAPTGMTKASSGTRPSLGVVIPRSRGPK